MMMACRTCRKMMGAALYGELSPRRQRKFESHRATCASCAEEYRALGLTLQLMDEREKVTVEPEYWEGFWTRLSRRLGDRSGAAHPRWRNWIRPLPQPTAPVWVSVAAALLLVATGVYLGRSTLPGWAGGGTGTSTASWWCASG